MKQGIRKTKTGGRIQWTALLLMLLLIGCRLSAQTADSIQLPDSLLLPDSTANAVKAAVEHANKMSWLRRTVRGFSYIDTNYVEPQLYDFTVMVQMTHTYDIYQLRTREQSITFSPAPTVKVGPYFGWRWFFLGYTFDLKHSLFSSSSQKREIDFSIYSAQVGLDLYYRRTGYDYQIRGVKLGNRTENKALEGLDFDGLNVGIMGFNLYYIFNHHRFSYPAAYAQSTRQKVSCGSWLAGIGYTRNSLDFDHEKLQRLLDEHTDGVSVDSGLIFNNIKYHDFCVSGGYAYNWVFARNWLLGVSNQIGLAYKKSKGETEASNKGFDFNNLNLDYIGRLGIVYNNSRWYAGASAVIHAYTYRKSRFSANNAFGSLNLYVGYNFGRKKK